MKHCYLFALAVLLMAGNLRAQLTIDFESFDLPADSFRNGAQGDTVFIADALVRFPVRYDAAIGFWVGGWALSTVVDSSTRDFTNLYGARPGAGYNGSMTYAVGQQGAGIGLTAAASPALAWRSLQVTNTTYAFYSMRDGDAFAKAFGGATGNDPDYLRLTIRGYRGGVELPDSIDFYLADFRFADNNQDYIVRDWTEVDLRPLANADSLSFTLSSTDIGDFGINTPLFFAIDQVRFEQPSAVGPSAPPLVVTAHPNPFVESLRVDNSAGGELHIAVFDSSGRPLLRRRLLAGATLPTAGWPRGPYWLWWSDGRQAGILPIVKQ